MYVTLDNWIAGRDAPLKYIENLVKQRVDKIHSSVALQWTFYDGRLA